LKVEKFKKIEYLSAIKNKSKAIILFHGYGANMQDLFGLSQYMGSEYDWYFPNGVQTLEHLGMYGGRAWFHIDMVELQKMMMSGQFRKFADKESAEFNQVQEEVIEYVANMANRYEEIIIGGFSQGAMLSSHIFTRCNPSGLILFSATLIDKTSLMTKLDSLKRPIKFFQSHGKEDAVLEYSQAMDLFELFKLYKMSGEFVSFTGGHEIPMHVIKKADEYLKGLSS
jgi:phospholipase/carboxylesterase